MNEHAPRNNPQYLDHHPNAVQDVEQAHFMASASHDLRSDIKDKRKKMGELAAEYVTYNRGGYVKDTPRDEVEAAQQTLVKNANEIRELKDQANTIEDEKALEFEAKQKTDKNEAD